MRGRGSSSSSEKSEDVNDTSSHQSEVDNWKSQAQIGTACKCGAHSSVPFSEGGREWLVAHVQEAHSGRQVECPECGHKFSVGAE